MMTIMLVGYVCVPALIAAVLFRGGLVLWMAGISFVRRDGKRASRLRVFWRALVAWSPLCLAIIGLIIMPGRPGHAPPNDLPFVLFCGLFCGLAVTLGGLAEARPAGPPRRNMARAAIGTPH